ncbi:MAG: ABC transporter ATP-binding protein [Chloroflexi bacterium]|nr:ABC transporter ATP-binding protein [Chloroflexota bacterium]MBP8055252.1 ABC transporter ATP-binding protein [Chloroflexota bacterium]
MPTYKTLWRLMRARPWAYLADTTSITIFYILIGLNGLVIRAFLHKLTGEAEVAWNLTTLLALLVGLACGRVLTLFAAVRFSSIYETWNQLLMGRNVFAYILGRPAGIALAPEKNNPPLGVGEVINRLRDDTGEPAALIIILGDQVGLIINAMIGAIIMVSINPWITAGTFVPLAGVVWLVSSLSQRIEQYRRANREATEQVSGAIGEIFGAVQAIQIANAESRVIAHLRQLNQQRQEAAIRDAVLLRLIWSLSSNMVTIGTGIILVLAAASFRQGAFTVGDLALFINYIWPITQLMTITGELWAGYKKAGVSFGRLRALMPGAPPEMLVAAAPLYEQGNFPVLHAPRRTPQTPLHTLTVHNLSYYHPGAEKGIYDINLTLQRGHVTVITGRIGAGKSTLLRVLLGVLPPTSGEIRWNDEIVSDLSHFFVPPHSAYTGQVPRLFSESLRDNLLLGLPEEEVNLPGAVYQAVLEKDVAEMERGLDTPVGPRGMRLSGGQVQRSAAARMFVHQPELLIFDDLSSALDVETEQILWERLFSQLKTPTCLVVSHRPAVLRRADHIIILRDGAVVDEGNLEELLARSRDMQALWRAEMTETGQNAARE